MFSCLKSDIEITGIEKNIGEMIINRSQKFYKNIAIQEKKNDKYYKTTWGKIFEKIIKFSNSLIDLGFQKGDKLAVISPDFSDILALELACISIGGIYIPIFKDYYPKQIEYMIGHCDPKFLVVYDEFLLEKVLSTTTIGRIEKIFLMEYDKKFDSSIFIYNFSDYFNNNNKEDLFYEYVSNIKENDPCLIIYTSGGSTGISKGAVFTHKNLLFYQKSLNYLLDITEKDNILSYFGWHQSFGIAEKFLSLYSGACLTIDRTPGINLDSLCKDIKQYKPTIYFGSARVFNQLVVEMENNIELKNIILHKDLNFCFASSSLPKRVINFAIKNNINIIHGWGITETLQYITLNSISSWKKNYSGYPLPNTEILIDNNSNEILVKGPSVINSYYKDSEKNELYFTEEHYLKTGECGEIKNKQLKILGKLDSKVIINNKELFLSNIEKIIEDSSIYIHHCFLFNDKQNIYSIIFPDKENLQNWYRKKFFYNIPLIDMIDEEEVIKLFKLELSYINNNELIDNKIKMFYISEKELTIKNGELTSSFTLVRKKVYENYLNIIEDILNKNFSNIKIHTLF